MYFRTVFIAVSEFVQFWIEAIVVQCLLFFSADNFSKVEKELNVKFVDGKFSLELMG